MANRKGLVVGQIPLQDSSDIIQPFKGTAIIFQGRFDQLRIIIFRIVESLMIQGYGFGKIGAGLVGQFLYIGKLLRYFQISHGSESGIHLIQVAK